MADSSSPSQDTICYKLGPAGRAEGEQWDLKGQTEIVQIFISYGEGIHSIQFQYVENGRLVMSPIFGSSNFSGRGFQAVIENIRKSGMYMSNDLDRDPILYSIKFDHPSEYITGMDGTFTPSRVEELKISTNRRDYGKFGYSEYDSRKKSFTFQFGPQNQFDGFHGSHDYEFLTSIGVYFKPLTAIASTVRGINQRVLYGTSREKPTYDDELLDEDDYY